MTPDRLDPLDPRDPQDPRDPGMNSKFRVLFFVCFAVLRDSGDARGDAPVTPLVFVLWSWVGGLFPLLFAGFLAGSLVPSSVPCSLLGVRCSVLAVGCILRCCLGGAGCGAQPSVHTRECFSLCCACSWHGLSLALACSPFLGSGCDQIVSGLVASLVATSGLGCLVVQWVPLYVWESLTWY